jgi:hypothetical protein
MNFDLLASSYDFSCFFSGECNNDVAITIISAIADKKSNKTMPSDTIYVFVVSFSFVGLFQVV